MILFTADAIKKIPFFILLAIDWNVDGVFLTETQAMYY